MKVFEVKISLVYLKMQCFFDMGYLELAQTSLETNRYLFPNLQNIL